MAKRNRKRDRRGPPKGQPITHEVLKQHGDVLARVLLLLKKKQPDLKSDEFWKLLKKRWTMMELETAVLKLQRSKDVAAFTALISISDHVVDEKGLLHAKGKTWVNLQIIAPLINMSYSGAQYFIEQNSPKIRSMMGHARSGQICRFYCLEDVQAVQEQRKLIDLPQCQQRGELKYEGRYYVSASKLAEDVGVSQRTALLAIEAAQGVRVVRARSVGGQVYTYYARADAMPLFKKRRTAQTCDKNGVIILPSGGRYAHLEGLQKITGREKKLLAKVCQSPHKSIRKCRGLDGNLKHTVFYRVDDVVKALRAFAKRRVMGSLQDWSLVSHEMQKIVNSLGRFPNYRDIEILKKLDLYNGIARYHGGLRGVASRMGYGPVTSELLTEHAEPLARVLLKLRNERKLESATFWKAIKSRWTAKDLRDAVERFKKAKSLDAFRKLLDQT